ncbi:MAG TPA: subclass B3 metallo-beta-lactamase [Holophagaceae bacterium]|nr:subclass B3 metallo-beta-lactamase [Holophagaceae bacterium]
MPLLHPRLRPAALLAFLPGLAGAQTPPEWSKPFPAHRMAGPVAYVGTAELGCYLIRGSQGHILLNTGLADSPPLILASLKALGIDPKAIKVLLTNQAHFDHVGGLAELQRLTGAQVWATAADAPLLRDGGASDPSGFTRFAPVKVDRVLADGERLTLGDLDLTVVETPGHSPGSASYQLTFREDGRPRRLLFANLPTVVMSLEPPAYPGIGADLQRSFSRLKALHPDLWVAAHASQFGLAAKHAAGSYVDPKGYREAVAEAEAAFEAKRRAGAHQPG